VSDTPCFEPEYGMSELLVNYYATRPDQHYLIHTKSANVDWMLDLDHREHTVMLWSLANETAARVIEPRSGSPYERIDAAAKCQKAGYPIRFKLKPIVPVKGWREQYSRIIDHMLKHTKPDSIGLFMIAWMDYAELKSCIDMDLLDPRFAQAVRDSAEEMGGVTAGPFPHEARAEVYQYLIDEIRARDPEVPVFLCTETLEMWQQFGPQLGMGPGNYICGCGPQCEPGMAKIPKVLEPMEMRS
jgi:spore photoproduct lyase